MIKIWLTCQFYLYTWFDFDHRWLIVIWLYDHSQHLIRYHITTGVSHIEGKNLCHSSFTYLCIGKKTEI